MPFDAKAREESLKAAWDKLQSKDRSLNIVLDGKDKKIQAGRTKSQDTEPDNLAEPINDPDEGEKGTEVL